MMSNQNPFEAFTNFNLSNLDLSKTMENFKIPGVDMDVLVKNQKKNIETLNVANRTAVEGIQTLAQRQAEILRQNMEEAVKASKEIASIGDPKEIPVKQVEIAKAAFENGLANMTELAEMTTKLNADAVEMISKRVAESFNDLQDALTPEKD